MAGRFEDNSFHHADLRKLLFVVKDRRGSPALFFRRAGIGQ